MSARAERDGILITGGAGYIGSHTARACLAAGRRVVIVDDLSSGDARNVPDGTKLIEMHLPDNSAIAELIEVEGISAIMHFAGKLSVPESVADPALYYTCNTSASLDLIETATKAGVEHFVFSSTAAVYGETSDAPVAEDSPLKPCNPYGASKLMVEQILADIGTATNLRSVCLRYFNVLGTSPGNMIHTNGKTPDHLMKVICKVARGEQAELAIYGDDYKTPDGTCVRDYIHVADIAKAHVLALDYLEAGGKSDVFNCGYGKGISVKAMLNAVETQLERKLPVREVARRPGDPASVVAASAKIRAALGWAPDHDDLSYMIRSALERGGLN